MTRRNVLAGVAVFSLMALPAHAVASQRARTVPPADAADGGEGRKAVPREEARRAEPRPPEPPPAAAASKPTIETAPARSEVKGPVVVTPTVVTSTNIGGVTVGHSFSVGNAFTVGHDTLPVVDSKPSSDRSRRHDRSRDDDEPTVVYVPFAVPVYVPVATSNDVTVPANETFEELPASITPSTSSSVRTRTRGYLTFSPWYSVGTNLQAGYPVLLPPPETFSEGNISSTVAQTTRTDDGSTASIAVVAYGKDVGGVAFMVQPADAAVYVDGRFVGSARDYSPEHEPLLLRFGVYTVELRAKGYATERFSAYVTLGEVVPFSGSMTKASTLPEAATATQAVTESEDKR
jgi:hypothetical protein